jgi:release factor glutamine methyltransferase
MSVLDMCTGSGCIIISLKHAKCDMIAHGIDVSFEALEVAKENARLNETKVNFIQSNLFERVEGKYDIIVSNPPYIPTKVIDGLTDEVKLHDPMLALDGKEDGLFFYREIIRESLSFLNLNGLLCFEIGHDQGIAVSELMKEAGFDNIVVIKDLAGLDRVVIGNT